MICGKCRNDLPEASFYPSAVDRKRNGAYCKLCIRAYNSSRKVEIAEASRRYRKLNKDKAYASHRSYVLKNRQRVAEWVRESERRARENLWPSYIRTLLSMRGKIPHRLIPEDLVSATRVNLLLKRLIKSTQQKGDSYEFEA